VATRLERNRHRNLHRPGGRDDQAMSALLPAPFTTRRETVGGVAINFAIAGSGPPVLFLHGYPQTHLMWHQVAPALAREHTVVLADLRGYGDSDKPTPGPDGEGYTKREMAHDQVLLMRRLGFDRFALVGHDRGARVSHRLALDAPEAVNRLVVIDVVPTLHVLGNVDREMASAYWHWFFLPLGGGVPERLIGADPEFFLRSLTTPLLSENARFDPAALAEYIRCFSDPAAIAATCADYRAAVRLDLELDEATARAGQQVTCPTLILWGERGFVGRHYDVLPIWREYAARPQGHGLLSKHFVPEEAPDETIAALREFLV
jgi:haloacetate dehalogenase